MSLRTRILSLTVGATVAVLLLFAIPLGVLEQRSAARDVEQAATRAAWTVADYVAAGGDASTTTSWERLASDRDEGTQVAIYTPDGTRYGPDLPGSSPAEDRDRDTDDTPSPADDDGDAGEHERDGDSDHDGPFSSQSGPDVDVVDGGKLVRVEVATAGGPTVVMAFADDAAVRHTLAERLLPLAVAGVVLLLLVGAAAEVLSRRLVRDLGRTADLADAIAGGDAVSRVPETGPPEVRRVAHALNGLAGRIEELLASEREAAADMSHRLRTPLMALRLDVDALPDGPARSELEDHVATLERTLTAVIHEARRSTREGRRVGCFPGPVAAESVAYWQPLIEDQDRRIEVALAPDLPEVHCSADDLRAAIDALVENCIAHTPDRTPVAVRARLTPQEPPRVVVEVRDQGPGFDADAVRRGRSDRGSTGLGLDIARRCARASGGDLVVLRESEAGGSEWTVVRLELGLA
ncbi:HAMP domain-containing histidine kinase [Nocardioides sp. GY 10113]|uniref:sensor histidine kinase n=1 Tax=Nocardioides sp. GY 10113 TaxID=2569761 RepID=UPI0010A90DA7|nr:HAMP domain-containing sensor histidine kinase [Nocardioides sp. GY 10113]TIC88318.1 HAMP domain-containing histidine kinase [Nocardioides sp. GY 10113]